MGSLGCIWGRTTRWMWSVGPRSAWRSPPHWIWCWTWPVTAVAAGPGGWPRRGRTKPPEPGLWLGGGRLRPRAGRGRTIGRNGYWSDGAPSPPQIADDADQDRQRPGQGPVDQHRGSHLIPVAPGGRQRGDQHRLHEPDPAGGEGDGGGQPGEGERGQHLRPTHLVVADPDVTQGHQQHKVQRQVT